MKLFLCLINRFLISSLDSFAAERVILKKVVINKMIMYDTYHSCRSLDHWYCIRYCTLLFTTWKREAFFSETCAWKMILRYFSIEAYK